MIKFLLFLALFVLGFFSKSSFAQNTESPSLIGEQYTALKPADEKPIIFETQDELDLTVPDRIEKCKLRISQNLDFPDRIQYTRELIWRYENAIVESSSQEEVSVVDQSVINSLEPKDGNPVSFFSQEELERTVPVKIEKLKSDIYSGNYSEDKLKILREQLWRFENAIVIERN